MGLINLIKESWLFDENLKGVTGPVIVAIILWSIRSVRRLLSPFFWFFKNNLSFGFLKLPVEEKINALKLIGEYKETDEKYDVIIKEFKLRQYGLLYPLPTLKVLFDYIHEKNIPMNNVNFLSFLDCYNIFECNRNIMPIHSKKKLTMHIVGYLILIIFLISYCVDLLGVIKSLYHSPVNFINVLTVIVMLVILIFVIRFCYVFVEGIISFILAVKFSKNIKEYYFFRREIELMKKYKV